MSLQHLAIRTAEKVGPAACNVFTSTQAAAGMQGRRRYIYVHYDRVHMIHLFTRLLREPHLTPGSCEASSHSPFRSSVASLAPVWLLP
jgi:hypothetical protein